MNDGRSRISKRLENTGDLLKAGAQSQVRSYKEKFESLVGVYDRFLNQLITSYSEQKVNTHFMKEFFGKTDLTFAGIDGTLHKVEAFDLLIFFAGAYSSTGKIRVNSESYLNVEYDDSYMEKGIGISSILPIYINEVPKVDQTLFSRDETGEIDDTITFSDSWIIDNAAFADYMMSLAEFYLGYDLASKHDVDLILLDRICSAEVASSYAETSDFRINLSRDCGLIGYEIDGIPFSETEWVYARKLFGNLALGTPPPRGEYMLSRVIFEIFNSDGSGLTREELIERMGIDSDTRKVALDKELEKGIRSSKGIVGFLERDGNVFIIKPEFKNIRARIKKLVEDVCERMFSEDPSISFDQRFKINGRWLTTNDLAFLSLCSLYLMVESCWSKRILLVGVAKDTAARDMKRQLLPVLNYLGIFKGGFQGAEQDSPDTDRMILQWISLQEREKLHVPWATIEYDTAFKTTVPHFEKKEGLVSGARRNQISLEKTFVKSYFQLCEAASESKLRSNVLLYDRLMYPGFDDKKERLIVLKHDYYDSPENPEPIEMAYQQEENNPIQEFIIQIFEKMTSKSIPELFGHIKPLYIADKVAKYHQDHFRSLIDSTSMWLSNRPELRELIYYLSTFRQRRASHEQTRRNT